MKLLFVIDHFGSGGAQRQMLYLASGLRKRNISVEFFIYYPDYSFYKTVMNEKDFVIHEYRKNSRFSINIINKLRDVIRSEKYDAILSFLGTPNTYCEIEKLLGVKTPLVVSIRNTYPFGKLSYSRYLREQLHRVATHITVNSYYHKYILEKVHPWMKGKILTIYNGVDLDLFSPSENCAVQKNDSNTNFIVVASTKRQKNLMGLVQALIIYKRKYKYVPCISWVGRISKNKHDYEIYKEAQKLLINNGLSSNWKWLGERNDIPELLNKHDAMILPSYYEGLPNVICEAFAAGLPVLVSNVCDHPKIVLEGVEGYLFDPGKPDEIAEKMKRFIGLKQVERRAMGTNARKYAEKHFSMNLYVDKYEQLFKQVLKNCTYEK